MDHFNKDMRVLRHIQNEKLKSGPRYIPPEPKYESQYMHSELLPVTHGKAKSRRIRRVNKLINDKHLDGDKVTDRMSNTFILAIY